MTATAGLSSEPPSGATAHVLVDDVDDPILDEGTWHHLRRVRRLDPGTRCTMTDGAGSWRWCRLGDGVLEPDGDTVVLSPPTPPLTVAFALTKSAKPELTVQKLTELGIDHIVPFRASRSVVRWDETKAAFHHRRWTQIARSAVEQSRRCWLPDIEPVTDVDDLARRGAVRLDRDGRAPSRADTLVAVGPEGGWNPEETARLPVAVGVGTTVLRAETAALTAGGLLAALRSGIVAPATESST
ncbi:MAG: RsmE family RNA methyltransferase [Acidimicrobiales bacterium]|nr:RsmE family RNA methyltransferase [Acidimicrobiales bacterium]